MRPAYVLIAILLLAAQPIRADGPSPSKVLVIGNPHNIGTVASWLEGDPMMDPRQVPARTHLTDLQGSDIQRFIRLYFPRNYEALLEFEYIMLVMIEVFHLTGTQQFMIYDAIYEEGTAALQDRSVMSMASYIAHEWADSIISDAFPNDADAVVAHDKWAYEQMGLRYVINTNQNVPPIFTPYKGLEGTEPYLDIGTTCITVPREGAVVTTYSIGRYDVGYAGSYPAPGFGGTGWLPHTMFWRYGNATTWTHQDMMGGNRYWVPAQNPYSIDLLLAEFMFATGRELPSDVMLVHRLRTKFANFQSVRGFIYSLLDFIDKFGANDAPVIGRMEEITNTAGVGKAQYLRQEYGESTVTMEGAIVEMEDLRSEAMKLKDRALFWVYLTEWLSITGVSLLTGFAIWTLMVRRRLYREVEVTKLVARD